MRALDGRIGDAVLAALVAAGLAACLCVIIYGAWLAADLLGRARDRLAFFVWVLLVVAPGAAIVAGLMMVL